MLLCGFISFVNDAKFTNITCCWRKNEKRVMYVSYCLLQRHWCQFHMRFWFLYSHWTIYHHILVLSHFISHIFYQIECVGVNFLDFPKLRQKRYFWNAYFKNFQNYVLHINPKLKKYILDLWMQETHIPEELLQNFILHINQECKKHTFRNYLLEIIPEYIFTKHIPVLSIKDNSWMYFKNPKLCIIDKSEIRSYLL